jgi:hypothetical protein
MAVAAEYRYKERKGRDNLGALAAPDRLELVGRKEGDKEGEHRELAPERSRPHETRLLFRESRKR